VGNLCCERSDNAQAEQPPRQRGHSDASPRRVSITIELAQISPSTVRGIRRQVQPDSPCARTSAFACSYDTTAATAATPSTASAVDHAYVHEPGPAADPAATLPLISAGTFRPGSATGPRPPSSRQAATGSTSLGPGRAPQIPGAGHPSPQPCRPRHPTGSGRADPRPAAIDPGLSTCRGVRDRVAACTLSALSAVMPENIHSGS
jgi:hypothetical protein